jgi:hypothetical protein
MPRHLNIDCLLAPLHVLRWSGAGRGWALRERTGGGNRRLHLASMHYGSFLHDEVARRNDLTLRNLSMSYIEKSRCKLRFISIFDQLVLVDHAFKSQ